MTNARPIDESKEQKEIQLLYNAFMPSHQDGHTILGADEGVSGRRYAELLSQLKSMPAEEDRANLNQRLRNFLKDLFYTALKDHGIDSSTFSLELCIAGSLARKQATAYSDIDCFLIFGDDVPPEIKKQIQEITQKIYFLADGLFAQSNQFCMDPVGISLFKLNGSVTELTDKILEQEPEDELGPQSCSVLNAVSISADNVLLTQLQRNLNAQGKKIDSKHYFNKVLTEFTGPKSRVIINIKKDLIRPIDFILQGLRDEEAKISVEEFDSSEKLLDELRRRNKITTSAKKLFDHVLKTSYARRKQLHEQFGREHEEIPLDKELRELIDLVGWLRGSLKLYIEKNLPVFDVVDGAYFSHQKRTANPYQKKLQMEMRLEEKGINANQRKTNWKAIAIFAAIGVGLAVLTVFSLGIAGVIGAGIVGGVSVGSVMAAGGGAFSTIGAAVGVTVGAHTVAAGAAAAAGAHAAATFIGAKIVFFGGLFLAGLCYGAKKLIVKPNKEVQPKTIAKPSEDKKIASQPQVSGSYNDYIVPVVGNPAVSPSEVKNNSSQSTVIIIPETCSPIIPAPSPSTAHRP